MSKADAVKSAGERLEAIEAWSKRSFIASTVAASCMGITTAIACYVVIDYVRLKWAAQDAAASFRSEMEGRMKANPSPITRGKSAQAKGPF